MKVYVKKDKVLKLLGEGKVYSKKDLMLKELKDVVAAAPANVTTPAQFKQVSTQNTSKHNIPTAVQIGQLDNRNQNNTGEGNILKFKNMNAGVENELTHLANNPAFKDSTAIVGGDEESNNNTETNPYESVKSRKVMDEMRANSVPFTKSELTAFLKSL